MKNLNKRTEFEKHLEQMFQDAEINPPDGMWNKIDSDLSKEEAGYFKRKAFIFKMLAAASIAFAMGIGIFSLDQYLSGSGEEIAKSQEQRAVENDLPNNFGISPLVEGRVDDEENLTLSGEEGSSNISDNSRSDSNERAIPIDDANNGNQSVILGDAERLSNSNTENNKFGTTTLAEDHNVIPIAEGEVNPEPEVLITSTMSLEPQGISIQTGDELAHQIGHIYHIPYMPRGASRTNTRKENNAGLFMASLDFSAGQFNPNFQQGASSAVTPSGPVAYDYRSEVTSFDASNKNFLLVRSAGQETKPELAYSYGANIGFKVTNRILLQTGFAYRKANTTTTTTGYIENIDDNSRIPIVASYQYQLEGLSSVKRIDEVGLNNRYEFASIPIRAGYIILNRKLNLTLLAGISSEIFMNNSIVDDSNFLQEISSNDASGSPYNSVYFNGTLGTMLGYSFAKNYSITLEPSYRMAINSFTKDSFYLDSYPSSFMLSFGVAYNFR